jgi:hypothetical protein
VAAIAWQFINGELFCVPTLPVALDRGLRLTVMTSVVTRAMDLTGLRYRQFLQLLHDVDPARAICGLPKAEIPLRDLQVD